MATGGYKIFSAKGTNVSNSPSLIPGLYEAIEGGNKKPLIVEDIILAGVEVRSLWLNFRPAGTNYAAIVGTGSAGETITKLIVKPDDTVYFLALNASVPSENPSGAGDSDGPSASM